MRPGNLQKKEKRIDVEMVLSEFEIPPVKDALVIGKTAAIGQNAAKRMIEAVAPEQFNLIPIEDDVIEAIFVKKTVSQMVPEEPLTDLIVAEVKPIMIDSMIIKVAFQISVAVKTTISIEEGSRIPSTGHKR